MFYYNYNNKWIILTSLEMVNYIEKEYPELFKKKNKYTTTYTYRNNWFWLVVKPNK